MIKCIKVSDIIITDDFKKTIPSPEKVDKRRAFFRKKEKFNKRILVDGDNRLIDGYIRYLILVENNIGYATVDVIDSNYHTAETLYVYGTHSCNPKEYVWRLPAKEFANKDEYVAGEKILVRTKYGAKVAKITRTLLSATPPETFRIKRVIKRISE